MIYLNIVILLFSWLSPCFGESCSTPTTSAVIREIKGLNLSKYQSKRLAYELKSSRTLIRDLTRVIKRQRIGVKKLLYHELSTQVAITAAFNELARTELRLILARYHQLKGIREILTPDQRRSLSKVIGRYY